MLNYVVLMLIGVGTEEAGEALDPPGIFQTGSDQSEKIKN